MGSIAFHVDRFAPRSIINVSPWFICGVYASFFSTIYLERFQNYHVMNIVNKNPKITRFYTGSIVNRHHKKILFENYSETGKGLAEWAFLASLRKMKIRFRLKSVCGKRIRKPYYIISIIPV